MKRIAFFIGSMGRGGAERVISILSNHYANIGYETDVIVLLENKVGYQLNKNTRLIDFSGSTESRMKRVPYWLKSIRSYVKSERPDVIVSFVARINSLVMLACTGLKTKIVVSERSDPRFDGRSKGIDIITKLLYPKVDKVVFQTKRAQEYFPKLKNCCIIPNPISVENKCLEKNANKVVNVGRLGKEKNQKLLINAFKKLHDVNQDSFLEIYGEGVLQDELQSQIDVLGLTKSVTLKGNVEDVIDRISDASIFCLSSNYEGLSNALLEAMMLGIPCISTNVAGADEYIEDGVNGYIVEVGNEDEFAEKLIDLYNDKNKQVDFSNKSKQTSKKFHFDNVICMWDEVILG